MQSQEQILLYRNLGERIRKAREQQEINQSLFAAMLELSRSSVVNIEKGRQRPSVHLLYEISKVLKLGLEDLIKDLIPPKNVEKEYEIKERLSYSLKNVETVRKIADLIQEELD